MSLPGLGGSESSEPPGLKALRLSGLGFSVYIGAINGRRGL